MLLWAVQVQKRGWCNRFAGAAGGLRTFAHYAHTVGACVGRYKPRCVRGGAARQAARRTARRLLEYFAQPDPPIAFIDQTVGTGPTSFDTTWDLSVLLRRVFISDEFYETAQTAGPGTKKSVKWPIDHVISTLRLLGMKPKGKQLIFGNTTVRDALINLGQVLLEPPSVFARSIVALQSSTAKIAFHLGDTPQSRPMGRTPAS